MHDFDRYAQLPTNNIAAIVPCYTALGNSTVILTVTGRENTVPAAIHTVINRLAQRCAIDLSALRRRSTLATSRSILPPLPLAPGLVLFPLKVRIPRIDGDSSIGYINLHAVTAVIAASGSGAEAQGYQAIVKLCGGLELATFWKPATVRKYLQFARLAAAAPSPSALPPELTAVSQKLGEAFYELLMITAAYIAALRRQ